MKVNFEVIRNVFSPLLERRRWACYRMVWDENRGKYNKIPISPLTGRGAKSNDPRTWVTFAQALSYMRKRQDIAGLMIALTEYDDLLGIDIDGCIDDEGHLSEMAATIIEIADSYTEVSPSGKGIRIMLRGNLPLGGRKNTANGVEMYDAARFLTLTGNHVPGTPMEINRRIAETQEIHGRFVQPERYRNEQAVESAADRQPRSMVLDDEDLLEAAQYSANGEAFEALLEGEWDGYPSQSEADAAFCCMLAFWTGWNAEQMDRIFRSSGLYRPKWDSVRYGDGRTYGNALINWAITNTNCCYMQEDEEYEH